MNNFTPQRRGLGRGLGSLIPTGPLPPEPGQAESTADWIGRVGEQREGSDEPSGDGAEHTESEHTQSEHSQSGHSQSGHSQSANQVSPAHDSRDEHGADERREPEQGQGAQPELQPVSGAYFAELPVTAIRPNPRQPRQVFEEDAMAELVHSIKEVGLLQPVVVRRTAEDGYELVMGERRWRATQEAGLETIPAIVRDTGDDALLRDALLENLHRAELNPLEEAAAYQQLLDDFGCTHEELAGRIGRSRPQITNTLRLLKLSPPVQRRVAAGVLSAGHARTLLGVAEPADQDRLAQRVVAEGISVRGLEELVAVGELGSDQPAPQRRARSSAPAVTDLAERLSDLYETRVKVDLGRSKGRITIEFASLPDLERIVAVMDPSYTRRHSDSEQLA
jgi:ParB family chromosome partitioning protein